MINEVNVEVDSYVLRRQESFDFGCCSTSVDLLSLISIVATVKQSPLLLSPGLIRGKSIHIDIVFVILTKKDKTVLFKERSKKQHSVNRHTTCHVNLGYFLLAEVSRFTHVNSLRLSCCSLLCISLRSLDCMDLL